MNIRKYILVISSTLVIAGCVLMSCESSTKNTETSLQLEESFEEKDETSGQLIRFNNVVFSVPSPYQFAFFIKDLGIRYNKEYLNPSKNVGNYNTNFKKALNMGIYGTDLGYLNIYEQVPDAIEYFATIEKLSGELNLNNAFDGGIINRIKNNMGNQDSLLYILSNTYREADAYLKDNDRNATSVLILAGGWIESLYILTQVYKSNPSPKVAQKIAEQKHPLDNLIKILSPYYNLSKEYITMIDQLIEIAYDFDGVDYKYEFKEPTHEPKKKFTTINSISELTISDEQIQNITKKIQVLRGNIIK
ncbi:MAG: hypothetical protein SNJ71_03035 [Bacteroidales bacterium]